MLVELFYFLLIGAMTGLAAGLLGIGGGLIIVPFSLIVFELLAANGGTLIPFEQQAHVAIATSLATIIFTSLSAIYFQHKKKAIDWSIFWLMAPGILAGAYLGAWVVGFIPRIPLLIIFATFVALVAIKMWFGWSPHSPGKLPGWLGMNSVATLIGGISALVGIGGGTMTVPFLNWGKIPLPRAIAVSSALGLPIAVSGSLGFLASSSYQGIAKIMAQNLMWGYIYLPAFFGIISASMLTARLGVSLSHKLSKAILSRVFAILLFLLAIKLYYGVLIA